MPSGGLANASAGYDTVDSILASLAKEVHKNRKYETVKEAEVQRLTDLLAKSEEACRELNASISQRETSIIRLKDAFEKAEEFRRAADEARKEARSERDDAKKDRDDAKGQRDDAKKERDSAHRDLDRATASYELLKVELENARAERNSAVKMLHQSQLETEEWKSEAEKRRIEVTYLQRELALWKEQAREAERRNLAVDKEILQELKEIRQATNHGLHDYTKIEDQQRFAPLTPASSRHAGGDLDRDSPSPVRVRGHRADNDTTVSRPSTNSHITTLASSSHSTIAGTKTPKVMKTPKSKAESSAFASTSTVKSKSKAKASMISDKDSQRSDSLVHSSIAPLPEESTSTSGPSSSKFPSVTRTRLVRRVSEHRFSIYNADVDRNGVEVKNEPEADDGTQQLDELTSGEGEGMDLDEGRAQPSNPQPSSQYAVQGSSRRPVASHKVLPAPAESEQSNSPWDLFSEDAQEDTQQQLVPGSSRKGKSASSTRRKRPSQPANKPPRNKARHDNYEDDEDEDDDDHVKDDDKDGRKGRSNRPTPVKHRPPRKRSSSVSSQVSSADELMITGAIPESPASRMPRAMRTPHPSSSSNLNAKKRAHTPIAHEGEDQVGKKRRKQ